MSDPLSPALIATEQPAQPERHACLSREAQARAEAGIVVDQGARAYARPAVDGRLYIPVADARRPALLLVVRSWRLAPVGANDGTVRGAV